MKKFDFLKFIQNGSLWCRMDLEVCFGFQNIIFMILDHLEIISEKISNTHNSTWTACFYHENWILLEKTLFSCRVEINRAFGVGS